MMLPCSSTMLLDRVCALSTCEAQGKEATHENGYRLTGRRDMTISVYNGVKLIT